MRDLRRLVSLSAEGEAVIDGGGLGREAGHIAVLPGGKMVFRQGKPQRGAYVSGFDEETNVVSVADGDRLLTGYFSARPGGMVVMSHIELGGNLTVSREGSVVATVSGRESVGILSARIGGGMLLYEEVADLMVGATDEAVLDEALAEGDAEAPDPVMPVDDPVEETQWEPEPGAPEFGAGDLDALLLSAAAPEGGDPPREVAGPEMAEESVEEASERPRKRGRRAG